MFVTANAVQELPAELLRKRRFDEIFFVDLRHAFVHSEIFAKHLICRKLDPASFDLPALAAASDGFSGAEIEQTIVNSLYDAASNGTPDQATLLNAQKQTRPLSVQIHEQVETLRAWAQGAARWRIERPQTTVRCADAVLTGHPVSA